jgi:hypothetical protein
MKLKMLKDGNWHVTDKGPRIFISNEKIEVPKDIPLVDAKYMIESGWAEEIIEKEEIQKIEKKVVKKKDK